MKKIRLVVFIGFLAILAGCQAPSGGGALSRQSVADRYNAAAKAHTECSSRVVTSSPNMELIDRYLIRNATDPRFFEKLASKEPVPEELIKTIVGWQAGRVACRTAFLNQIAGQDIRLTQVYVAQYHALDNLTLSLAKGEIATVGELNKRQGDLNQQFSANRTSVYAALNSEMRQANAAEQQQRAAAAQIMMNNWANTQQLIQQQSVFQNQYLQNLMKPPVTTNCYVVGNSLSCTSQ